MSRIVSTHIGTVDALSAAAHCLRAVAGLVYTMLLHTPSRSVALLLIFHCIMTWPVTDSRKPPPQDMATLAVTNLISSDPSEWNVIDSSGSSSLTKHPLFEAKKVMRMNDSSAAHLVAGRKSRGSGRQDTAVLQIRGSTPYKQMKNPASFNIDYKKSYTDATDIQHTVSSATSLSGLRLMHPTAAYLEVSFGHLSYTSVLKITITMVCIDLSNRSGAHVAHASTDHAPEQRSIVLKALYGFHSEPEEVASVKNIFFGSSLPSMPLVRYTARTNLTTPVLITSISVSISLTTVHMGAFVIRDPVLLLLPLNRPNTALDLPPGYTRLSSNVLLESVSHHLVSCPRDVGVALSSEDIPDDWVFRRDGVVDMESFLVFLGRGSAWVRSTSFLELSPLVSDPQLSIGNILPRYAREWFLLPFKQEEHSSGLVGLYQWEMETFVYLSSYVSECVLELRFGVLSFALSRSLFDLRIRMLHYVTVVAFYTAPHKLSPLVPDKEVSHISPDSIKPTWHTHMNDIPPTVTRIEIELIVSSAEAHRVVLIDPDLGYYCAVESSLLTNSAEKDFLSLLRNNETAESRIRLASYHPPPRWMSLDVLLNGGGLIAPIDAMPGTFQRFQPREDGLCTDSKFDQKWFYEFKGTGLDSSMDGDEMPTSQHMVLKENSTSRVGSHVLDFQFSLEGLETSMTARREFTLRFRLWADTRRSTITQLQVAMELFDEASPPATAESVWYTDFTLQQGNLFDLETFSDESAYGCLVEFTAYIPGYLPNLLNPSFFVRIEVHSALSSLFYMTDMCIHHRRFGTADDASDEYPQALLPHPKIISSPSTVTLYKADFLYTTAEFIHSSDVAGEFTLKNINSHVSAVLSQRTASLWSNVKLYRTDRALEPVASCSNHCAALGLSAEHQQQEFIQSFWMTNTYRVLRLMIDLKWKREIESDNAHLFLDLRSLLSTKVSNPSFPHQERGHVRSIKYEIPRNPSETELFTARVLPIPWDTQTLDLAMRLQGNCGNFQDSQLEIALKLSVDEVSAYSIQDLLELVFDPLDDENIAKAKEDNYEPLLTRLESLTNFLLYGSEQVGVQAHDEEEKEEEHIPPAVTTLDQQLRLKLRTADATIVTIFFPFYHHIPLLVNIVCDFAFLPESLTHGLHRTDDSQITSPLEAPRSTPRSNHDHLFPWIISPIHSIQHRTAHTNVTLRAHLGTLGLIPLLLILYMLYQFFPTLRQTLLQWWAKHHQRGPNTMFETSLLAHTDYSPRATFSPVDEIPQKESRNAYTVPLSFLGSCTLYTYTCVTYTAYRALVRCYDMSAVDTSEWAGGPGARPNIQCGYGVLVPCFSVVCVSWCVLLVAPLLVRRWLRDHARCVEWRCFAEGGRGMWPSQPHAHRVALPRRLMHALQHRTGTWVHVCRAEQATTMHVPFAVLLDESGAPLPMDAEHTTIAHPDPPHVVWLWFVDHQRTWCIAGTTVLLTYLHALCFLLSLGVDVTIMGDATRSVTPRRVGCGMAAAILTLGMMGWYVMGAPLRYTALNRTRAAVYALLAIHILVATFRPVTVSAEQKPLWDRTADSVGIAVIALSLLDGVLHSVLHAL